MKKLLILSALVASLFAADVKIDVTKCISCHGITFERSALNKSKVVKDLDSFDIYYSLKSYRDSNYGTEMKLIMKMQVKDFSDSELKEIAKKIESLAVLNKK